MTIGTSQGLFVVIAMIIFGIFTLTSYVVFKDTLKPTLANIFTDGLEQSKNSIAGIQTLNINMQEAIDDGRLVVKNDGDLLFLDITTSDDKKTLLDIQKGVDYGQGYWIQLEKKKDNYIITGLNYMSPDNPDYNGEINEDGTYANDAFQNNMYADYMMTTFKDLIIPDSINGITITEISDYVFIGYNAGCGIYGKVKLPNKLEKIGNGNFTNMHNFMYLLNVPDTLTYVGDDSFATSPSVSVVVNNPEMVGDSQVMNTGMIIKDYDANTFKNITHFGKNSFFVLNSSKTAVPDFETLQEYQNYGVTDFNSFNDKNEMTDNELNAMYATFTTKTMNLSDHLEYVGEGAFGQHNIETINTQATDKIDRNSAFGNKLKNNYLYQKYIELKQEEKE